MKMVSLEAVVIEPQRRGEDHAELSRTAVKLAFSGYVVPVTNQAVAMRLLQPS
jgi:hypothetical protein